MLITIFGESCTGKSTLADALKERTGAQVYSGKDYLRLAKSEGMAKALFQKQLKEAAAGEGDLIYVIAEPELLALSAPLPRNRYAFQSHRGLWYCPCGGVNREYGQPGSRCVSADLPLSLLLPKDDKSDNLR